MYLNDVQRTSFYEGIGLNTREFDMHVIVEVLADTYTKNLKHALATFFDMNV